MRAGPLRHLVSLQSPTASKDALGDVTNSFAEQDQVWASIEPLSAKELLAAGQNMMEITHKIMFRYDGALSVDHSWRVVYGSRTFMVQGVRNINERNQMIELLCSEGLRDS